MGWPRNPWLGCGVDKRCGSHAGYVAAQKAGALRCDNCRSATTSYQREYYANNPDSMKGKLEYQRAYRSRPKNKKRKLEIGRNRYYLSGGDKYRREYPNLLKRDGHWCSICDEAFTINELSTLFSSDTVRTIHIDHIWPASVGGPSDIWNLRLAHAKCNMGRKNRMVTEDWIALKQNKAIA